MLLRLPTVRASRRLVAFTACLASLMLGQGHAAEQGRAETGRILGRVRLGVRPAGRPLSTDAYNRQISAPAAPSSELANVLVWIKDAPRTTTVPTSQAELHQRGEMFVPHVVAVTAGSTVTFPNDDALFHNVFSLSRAGTFDLGRYPQGDTRVRKFDQAGVVKVYCHLHSHMSAIIAVFDHPWFAQAAPDGSFAIDRVPAGRYLLTGWHERAGNTDQPVTIEPGATTRVELLVPIEP
jgi:plastocyanin